jgi:hypothetical protein
VDIEGSLKAVSAVQEPIKLIDSEGAMKAHTLLSEFTCNQVFAISRSKYMVLGPGRRKRRIWLLFSRAVGSLSFFGQLDMLMEVTF